MALNCYVMPIVVTGTRHQLKYIATFSAFGWGMFDYGNEPWGLVGIVDIDGATDTALKSHADCIALPQNLDQTVGAAAGTVSTDLESVNIPGTWVTSANTWRDVIEFVGAVCQFAQRFQGMNGGQWFTGGVTLATTFGSLPTATRNAIIADALSWTPPMDTSQLVAGSTLRQVLRSAGQQYLATQPPLVLAGVQI